MFEITSDDIKELDDTELCTLVKAMWSKPPNSIFTNHWPSLGRSSKCQGWRPWCSCRTFIQCKSRWLHS